jgi:hypothetical protein
MNSNCRRRSILSEGFLRKLLKCRVGCCFRVLPESVFAKETCSFKAGTTVVLRGRGSNSIVFLRADVLENPLRLSLSFAICSWRISSIIFSTSTVNFLSGYLSSSDPVVFSLLLTKLFGFKWLSCKLTPKFLRHFPEGSLFEIYQTLFDSILGDTLLRHCRTETHIYQQQTRWFTVCNRRRPELHSHLKTVRES